MRVQDVMTPHVVSVPETATLAQALELLVRRQMSALVVVDAAGAPKGVLSEGDLLKRAEIGTQGKRPGWLDFLLGAGRAAKDYELSHGRRVGEIMTRGAISVAPEAELAEAVDLMLSKKIKRLIVTRDGRAVGVISRSDILKALMASLPVPAGDSSDAAIQAQIEAEIERENWAPTGTIRVGVAGGVVTFEGAITDERLRGGLHVIAENTPGVKKVIDRLAWIEPYSGMLISEPGPDAQS